MNKNLIAIALAATIAAPAMAQENPDGMKLRMTAGLGISGGGEKLATIKFENGNTQSIRTGQGVSFTGGVDLQFTPTLSAQATVSYHVDNSTGKNGSVKFARVPVDLLGFYHINDSWKVGGGLRYLTNAKFSGSGVASFPTVNFEKSLSKVIEAEYLITPRAGVKVRYVFEELKLNNSKEKINADHFGVSVFGYF